jgi:all-trans-8'-apo-beta-carotenal 15,15'-oxygenase
MLRLKGTFIRNGPGLSEIFGTTLVHPIDGDGYICALSFENGQVHFKSRFVQTFNHAEESAAQTMLYPGQMGTMPPAYKAQLEQQRAKAKAKSSGVAPAPTAATNKAVSKKHMKYRNPSNTNVVVWGGRLLSCYETGVPFFRIMGTRHHFFFHSS